MLAMRKRTPRTAKVTSPTIGEGVWGLAVSAPRLRESRSGFVHHVAHLHEGAETGLVGHRPHHQRPDNVPGHRDRDDRRTPALHEALESRGTVRIAQRVPLARR